VIISTSKSKEQTIAAAHNAAAVFFPGFFLRALIGSDCFLSNHARETVPRPSRSPAAFTLSNIFGEISVFHCHPFLRPVSIIAWRDEPEHSNPDFPAMQV